jgi:hypothetical protein
MNLRARATRSCTADESSAAAGRYMAAAKHVVGRPPDAPH